MLGDGGPITLQPTDSQVSISRDGTISVREGNSNVDSQRGKLKLVTIANAALLTATTYQIQVQASDGAKTSAATAVTIAVTDAALYQAKRAGRNRSVSADPGTLANTTATTTPGAAARAARVH